MRRHPHERMTIGGTQTLAVSKKRKHRRSEDLDVYQTKATDRTLMGRGYRPDITRVSDRSAFEYGGTMYYDEIDRIIYRVRERKARRVAGLPAGAHVDDIPLRELIKKKAKDPVRVGSVRHNEEGEDELALLRYD